MGQGQSRQSWCGLEKIQKLYQKIFSKDAHKAINEAMLCFPSLAIFAKFTNQPDAPPSILDTLQSGSGSSKSSDVHCLAAVTYCTDKQHSVLLWLATTNENAPKESVHHKWGNLGLSTYLLCMVIKQHTATDSSIEHSVLSIQVSIEAVTLYRFFQ